MLSVRSVVSAGRFRSLRLAEDEGEFVRLVDAEDVGIAERAQAVVLLAPVPDDGVIEQEAAPPQLLGEVGVEGGDPAVRKRLSANCKETRCRVRYCYSSTT